LAWNASTDNVGVTGYEVYRGTTLATTVAATSATVSGLTPDTDHVFTVKAKDAAGNASKASTPLTVRTAPGGGRTFRNDNDFAIRDFAVTTSPIKATVPGQAPRTVAVEVTAAHTCTQDLNITLVGPSGRTYPLQRYGGYPCTAFPSPKAFSATGVGEQASGTWTLRIGDNGPGDTGTLDAWSITL
jgi:streptogrisin C